MPVAAGHLTGHHVVVVAGAALGGGFGAATQLDQGGEELGAGAYPASLALLADELDSLATDVAPTQVDDLSGPQAGQAEPDDDFVPQAGFGAILAGSDQAIGFSPGEEPRRVLPLHLAVEPGHLAQRVIPTGQGFDQVGIVRCPARTHQRKNVFTWDKRDRTVLLALASPHRRSTALSVSSAGERAPVAAKRAASDASYW